MAPWKNDIERAMWVLSDIDVDRIPEEGDGRQMRLISDFYVCQTKYNSKNNNFWKEKRILIGRYDHNGDFQAEYTVKRCEAVALVGQLYRVNRK